jgi:hypothetical protein
MTSLLRVLDQEVGCRCTVDRAESLEADLMFLAQLADHFGFFFRVNPLEQNHLVKTLLLELLDLLFRRCFHLFELLSEVLLFLVLLFSFRLHFRLVDLDLRFHFQQNLLLFLPVVDLNHFALIQLSQRHMDVFFSWLNGCGSLQMLSSEPEVVEHHVGSSFRQERFVVSLDRRQILKLSDHDAGFFGFVDCVVAHSDVLIHIDEHLLQNFLFLVALHPKVFQFVDPLAVDFDGHLRCVRSKILFCCSHGLVRFFSELLEDLVAVFLLDFDF